MKYTHLFLVLGCLAALNASATQDFATVSAPVERVFAPKGFDTNDDTQVIISGVLPNLCYRNIKSTVQVKDKTIDVSLTVMKDIRPTSVCAAMAVPYLEVVNVGMLEKGEYSVSVNGNSIVGGKLTSLGVEPAIIGDLDNHIYADVDSIKKIDGSRVVRLEGYLPSTCLQLDRIEAVSNGVDTYSVLPIMKQVDEHCPQKLVSFSYEFTVPTVLKAKNVLLHVRALKGRSVNMLFENKTKTPAIDF